MEKKLLIFVCKKICEVFEFDPVIGNYTKEKNAKKQEWIERKAKELNVSTKEVRKGLKNLVSLCPTS